MKVASLHAWVALPLLLGLGACAPKLDWREVRPAGSGLVAWFPCKPKVETRAAQPGGTPTPQGGMGLAVCRSEELSFSVAWADVVEPSQVGPALQQMRESLLAKLAAQAGPAQALAVPGMTPNPQALQHSLQAAGGAAAGLGQVAVFARGLRVYQAVMLGATRKADSSQQAWETFVTALRVEP